MFVRNFFAFLIFFGETGIIIVLEPKLIITISKNVSVIGQGLFFLFQVLICFPIMSFKV